jgi:hypothetical protein
MIEMTPCRRCGSERGTCPRCGYLACSCEPCACETGAAGPVALEAMRFYDVHGCSRSDLAARRLDELQRGVREAEARGEPTDGLVETWLRKQEESSFGQ